VIEPDQPFAALVGRVLIADTTECERPSDSLERGLADGEAISAAAGRDVAARSRGEVDGEGAGLQVIKKLDAKCDYANRERLRA
jgi:hypothetical protein